MYVRHLQLGSFRSWERVDLALGPGPTVFVGRNGEGKTNLVEAVGYLATMSSHRVSSDAPLVRHGDAQAVVRAALRRGDRELLVEIEINPGRANRVRVNRARCRARGSCSAWSARCSSRRRTSRSCAATRPSGGASSTSSWSPGRPGWPACGPTTTGCSSSATPC